MNNMIDPRGKSGPLVLVGCGKAKRDPTDPDDLEEAVIGPGDPVPGASADEGPAWRARELYTSNYINSKFGFGDAITEWASDRVTPSMAILSAEHGVVFPDELLTYYNTSVDDLGDDPNDPEDRVEFSNIADQPRRPDGKPVVTEVDMWAHDVAVTLSSWVRSFQPLDVANPQSGHGATSLIVLAGQRYLKPLKERGVFTYGASRIYRSKEGDHGLPISTRFLFEEIDAGGNGSQARWLNNAVERIEATQ